MKQTKLSFFRQCCLKAFKCYSVIDYFAARGGKSFSNWIFRKWKWLLANWIKSLSRASVKMSVQLSATVWLGFILIWLDQKCIIPSIFILSPWISHFQIYIFIIQPSKFRQSSGHLTTTWTPPWTFPTLNSRPVGSVTRVNNRGMKLAKRTFCFRGLSQKKKI